MGKRRPFECQRCSQCCSGEGAIYFRGEQVPYAAQELGLKPAEFLARFCGPAENGRYPVLCDSKGVCRLLGPQGCLVHACKPDICLRWPFFENILTRESAFQEAKLVCPGIDPEVSFQEFAAYGRAQLDEEKDVS